jgi:hypothetical protein
MHHAYDNAPPMPAGRFSVLWVTALVALSPPEGGSAACQTVLLAPARLEAQFVADALHRPERDP